jgi:A/G-specific adenine glycosylase
MTNDEWRMTNEKGKVCGRYGDVNQALMELGATVCVPLNPRCAECPARDFCRAFAEGRTAELPVKGKRGATPEVRGVAVVILRSQKSEVGRQKTGKLEVLLMKRPRGGIWEEMWEFPVLWREVRRQKTEDGRKEQKARSNEREVGIERRILRELGIEVESLECRGGVRHQLTHRLMRYDVVVCRAKRGQGEVKLPACITGGEYMEARWVVWPVEKKDLPMARVVGKILEREG